MASQGSQGSELSIRMFREEQKAGNRLINDIVFGHFKRYKVEISAAIKKTFPFLETLRDRKYISEKMFQDCQESCRNLVPVNKVVYTVLSELEKTFKVDYLEALFSEVHMREYPELTHVWKSFENVIQERNYGMERGGEDTRENPDDQLNFEQGFDGNSSQSLTWPQEEPSASNVSQDAAVGTAASGPNPPSETSTLPSSKSSGVKTGAQTPGGEFLKRPVSTRKTSTQNQASVSHSRLTRASLQAAAQSPHTQSKVKGEPEDIPKPSTPQDQLAKAGATLQEQTLMPTLCLVLPQQAQMLSAVTQSSSANQQTKAAETTSSAIAMTQRCQSQPGPMAQDLALQNPSLKLAHFSVQGVMQIQRIPQPPQPSQASLLQAHPGAPLPSLSGGPSPCQSISLIKQRQFTPSLADPPDQKKLSDSKQLKKFVEPIKQSLTKPEFTQGDVKLSESQLSGKNSNQPLAFHFKTSSLSSQSRGERRAPLEKSQRGAEKFTSDPALSSLTVQTSWMGTEGFTQRKTRSRMPANVLKVLEENYQKNTKPSKEEMTKIAKQFNMDYKKIYYWFYNRRKKEDPQDKQQ